VSELDDLYGRVIQAQSGLKNWETNESLKTYELDQTSAQDLAELLVLAQNGALGQTIMQALTFLWVINSDGDIIFALEETINLQGTARRPRMRGIPLNSNVKPLGHPLLVGGAGARIGGELYIDEAEGGTLTWVLDNRSGRYGTHPSRNNTHLENAADVFRRYRLPIETDFVEIR